VQYSNDLDVGNSHIAMPKSEAAIATGNFGHFQSLAQHINGCV